MTPENKVLDNFLRANLLSYNDNYAKSLHHKYLDHRNAVFIIFGRLKEETGNLIATSQQILKFIEEGVKSDNTDFLRASGETLDTLECLKLDVESFYIFLRAYLDDLCKIIRFLCKSKYELPSSMNDLLFTKKFSKFRTISPAFFDNLKTELIWFENFRDDRKNFLHGINTVTFGGINGKISFFSTLSGEKITISNKSEEIMQHFQDFIDKIGRLENFLVKNFHNLNTTS